MRDLKLLGLVLLASIPQALLAAIAGVPPLHWWQWSAISAPLVLLVYLAPRIK